MKRRVIVVPIFEELAEEARFHAERWQLWACFTGGAVLGFIVARVAHFLTR